MKIQLTTLNAKYIHTSLALRWLYVANKDRFDIAFTEYTIKENIETIAQELINTRANIVAIGVYIWNVKQTEHLIKLLKQNDPQVTIILGGPEVMYDPEYFLQNWQVEYIISGEGEFVLGELLDALQQGVAVAIDGVSCKQQISKTIVQADLQRLAMLQSPYTLDEDREMMKNKLVYFESSRGCPYQCSYCLSSLEKGVRYFPHDYILTNLNTLIDHGAKQIKFLDRTFNLNKEHTLSIFQFLIDKYHPKLVCQFEIYADLLTDDTIDF